MQLTGYQVQQINAFMGGDYDCSVTIDRLPDHVTKDNELREAGLYIWVTDYPEEGSVYLPEVDPDSVGDERDYFAHEDPQAIFGDPRA